VPADLIAVLDATRTAQGLLTIAETLALSAAGNLIHDPFSTLIAKTAQIGSGNICFPNTQVLCSTGRQLRIGNDNRFLPGSLIDAQAGDITIGNSNQFGDGGFTAIANRAGGSICVGSYGRFQRGATLYAQVAVGDGCQILGPIAVQDCVLSSGGDHTHPEADERGSVLKGIGTARTLTLKQGEVIQGHGVFSMDDLKMQSFFHPKAK
jgi:bifunctional N-acetylglucosamine-1-phosphate-uridyltransferase/glucosamine-1-phosphate-acetyltransferase GlmU-like protein